MRYAQIIGSKVFNPCDGPDLATALEAAFAPSFVETELHNQRPWVPVPDGAPANATLDGRGGWTAPAPAPEPDPTPVEPTVQEIVARIDGMQSTLRLIAKALNIPEDQLP